MASYTNVSYNGNSLQTASVFVTDINHVDMPTIDAKVYALSHANASYIPFYSYPSKTVTVSGTVYGTSITDLDGKLDTFKSYLSGKNQNLDFDYNGATRRYIATVTKTSITRPNNLTYAIFTVEFTCTNPFGMDTGSTSLISASGRTSASYTDTPTFGGTAYIQLPVFTVTYTALSPTTSNVTVSISNNTTGQQINVTRQWGTSDVLVVDTTQSVTASGVSTPVTVNGAAVAFSGAFPVFPPGSSTIGYADGFASRTFNYSVSYTKLYF